MIAVMMSSIEKSMKTMLSPIIGWMILVIKAAVVMPRALESVLQPVICPRMLVGNNSKDRMRELMFRFQYDMLMMNVPTYTNALLPAMAISNADGTAKQKMIAVFFLPILSSINPLTRYPMMADTPIKKIMSDASFCERFLIFIKKSFPSDMKM